MMNFINQPNQAGTTTDEAAMKKRQAVAQALAKPPQNIGDGINALGQAMLYRAQQQNGALPAAPGNAQPSFMTAMQHMLSRGNNGGLR